MFEIILLRKKEKNVFNYCGKKAENVELPVGKNREF